MRVLELVLRLYDYGRLDDMRSVGYQLEIALAEGREVGLLLEPLEGLGAADISSTYHLMDLLSISLQTGHVTQIHILNKGDHLQSAR